MVTHGCGASLRFVSLRQLFPAASFVDCADLWVDSAVDDSRRVTRGDLFACRTDLPNAADYFREAQERGAVSLLVDRPLGEIPLRQCIVPNVRDAYARLCAALAGDPSKKVAVAGVTGTNGKTTVTWLVRSALMALGRPCGLLGTIEYSDGEQAVPSRLTTPGPDEQGAWLERMAALGVPYAAMEVSSHALDQSRIAGTSLAVAAVTNITQDHFDYHGNYEGYWSAKARILEHLIPHGTLILNLDDAGCARLRTRSLGLNVMGTSLAGPADITAEVLEESLEGTRFRLKLQGQDSVVHLPLLGRHNVSNALTAAGVLASPQFGFSTQEIAEGLSQRCVVPGRLEPIRVGQRFEVLVDYAHTDDALRRCLTAVRSLTPGRVICVFGAGGDRDCQKRPLMGEAALLADVAIVTSDNPRSEPPNLIIDQIVAGMPQGSYLREPDRRTAIALGISLCGPGDALVIAGKGHERTQVIGKDVFEFDDCQVARSILQTLRQDHFHTMPPTHLRPVSVGIIHE